MTPFMLGFIMGGIFVAAVVAVGVMVIGLRGEGPPPYTVRKD